MKKTIVIILSVAVGIIILWAMLRVTHIFETYNIATTSNEPTYKPRSIVMASRLKKPDYGDFICFKDPNKTTWIFRCIGKEGDLVEIKDSKVYLNGKELNEPYIDKEYYITNAQLDSIKGFVEKYNYPVHSVTDSLHVITLTEDEAKQYHLNLKLFTLDKGTAGVNIFGDFKALKYNADNLGPIRVPKNCYFVLGDNRHNAMDSRYLGFISSDDVVSTVIN